MTARVSMDNGPLEVGTEPKTSAICCSASLTGWEEPYSLLVSITEDESVQVTARSTLDQKTQKQTQRWVRELHAGCTTYSDSETLPAIAR